MLVAAKCVDQEGLYLDVAEQVLSVEQDRFHATFVHNWNNENSDKLFLVHKMPILRSPLSTAF